MIPLLAARFAIAALAVAVARNRPALRPVAVALCALAALAAGRVYGLPARLDVLTWVAWPGVGAWLAVRVWRCRGEASTLALAWLAYAAAVALWRWRDPLAYAAAIRAPHVVAVGVAAGAWVLRRRISEPPGALAHARAVAAVLAVSAAVDVVAGAWAGPWRLAAPVSWATLAVVAMVLLLALRR